MWLKLVFIGQIISLSLCFRKGVCIVSKGRNIPLAFRTMNLKLKNKISPVLCYELQKRTKERSSAYSFMI